MSQADDGDMSREDVGRYCRAVEAHLTRANAGHLVRVVGPAFELVRTWAIDGVPLSVVARAIDDRAERHRATGSAHALRIEFCEADVRDAFRRWRRAVGVPTSPGDAGAPDARAASEAGGRARPDTAGRRPSLNKHLDRVVDRLSRAGGSLELPESLRHLADAQVGELTAMQAEARGARGASRDALAARLRPLDHDLMTTARAAVPPKLIEALHLEADMELARYRGRITPEAWQQAVEVTVDRLLRERLGLPVLELEDTRGG